MFATKAGESSPAKIFGFSLARQKISSAIQFPIPGKRSCIRSSDLSGVRFLRAQKSATKPFVNPGERIGGGNRGHQLGRFSPLATRNRPKQPRSEKNNHCCAPRGAKWSCFF